jgi:hypothetical protein
MEWLWNVLAGIGPETISAVVLGILGLAGFNLKSKLTQMIGLMNALTTALEDGKLDAKELKDISTRASVLFTGRAHK